jgi:hypothetical protein
MFLSKAITRFMIKVCLGSSVAAASNVTEVRTEMTMFIDLSDYLPNDLTQGERFKDVSKVVGCVGHHTATTAQSWKTIAEFHVSVRAWKVISYDIGIAFDGLIYKLKPFDILGYQSSGSNRESFAICLLGNYSKVHPTPLMKDSFHRVMLWMYSEYELRYFMMHFINKLYNEKGATECPGVFNYGWMSKYQFDNRPESERYNALLTWPQNDFLEEIER